MGKAKNIVVLLIMVSAVSAAFAQTTSPGLGSWTSINLRGKVKGAFYFMFEAQTRSESFYNKFFYHEFKGGIGLNLNKRFAIFAGVGKYDTYTKGGEFAGPRTANEVRTWFEGTIKDNIGRLFLEHRYRIEQRFFTTGYRNRFRYRLGIAIPLNHKKMETKTVYISTFDELFLTNTTPYFERNRFYIGAGYRINPVTVQAGWVNQLDYKITTGGVAKNFFQLTISVDFGGKNSTPTRLPFEEG